MPTLYSSVIHLTNLRPATLTHTGGQHAHAAFLDIVRSVEPELAETLHNLNGRKPFTVSPLMVGKAPTTLGLPRPKTSEVSKTSEVYLREGWNCWLRVTMLDDALFKTFLTHFLNGGQLPKIRLGEVEFLVSEIQTTPGSHPWAGYTPLDDLKKRLDEPAPRKFAFELHTPTSFKLRDEQVTTIPTPKLVFGNLATAWKALTGENFVRVVEEYAEQALITGDYRLRTQKSTLHNLAQVGALGRVEFIRTDKTDHPTARALNLLADLAFYTGLGRKTAQGMGMASRIS